MRAFVAIELSAAARQGLSRIVEQARGSGIAGIRWLDPAGIHLTLQFLGETPAENAPSILDALSQAATGVPRFTLALHGLGAFPSLASPRVVWIGVGGDLERLHTLQRRVEERLALQGFMPESRRYSAHLTVGRVTRRLAEGQLAAMRELARRLDAMAPVPLPATEVSLMESVLRPQGAQYVARGRVELERAL